MTQKITQAIEPSLDDMGYAVVQVRLSEGARRKTLTVMAERKDDIPMGFDDCADISRTVSALLDVEDPIASAYDLEVCSPGLERPLTRPEDFIRFAGHEAKLETMVPIEGRKRFKGIIKGMNGEKILLDMLEGPVAIDLRNLRSGKLSVPVAAPAKPKTKKKK